jgi:hypothetical protein
MESATPRRVLLVANRTAATPDLLAHVKRLAAERPTTFALLIPDAPRSKETDWTFEVALPLLQRSAGSPVEGLTGEHADPLEAIRKVVATGDYDAIVMSTLPRRASVWLRRDLPHRVRALGLPVTVITQEEDRDRDKMGAAPAGMGIQ